MWNVYISPDTKFRDKCNTSYQITLYREYILMHQFPSKIGR